MNKHKWNKEIKAWADGAEIESHFKLPRHGNTGWFVSYTPLWNDDNYEHRIKSQPKEPQYLYVYVKSNGEIIFAERQVDTVHKMVGKIKLEQENE